VLRIKVENLDFPGSQSGDLKVELVTNGFIINIASIISHGNQLLNYLRKTAEIGKASRVVPQRASDRNQAKKVLTFRERGISIIKNNNIINKFNEKRKSNRAESYMMITCLYSNLRRALLRILKT